MVIILRLHQILWGRLNNNGPRLVQMHMGLDHFSVASQSTNYNFKTADQISVKFVSNIDSFKLLVVTEMQMKRNF